MRPHFAHRIVSVQIQLQRGPGTSQLAKNVKRVLKSASEVSSMSLVSFQRFVHEFDSHSKHAWTVTFIQLRVILNRNCVSLANENSAPILSALLYAARGCILHPGNDDALCQHGVCRSRAASAIRKSLIAICSKLLKKNAIPLALRRVAVRLPRATAGKREPDCKKERAVGTMSTPVLNARLARLD